MYYIFVIFVMKTAIATENYYLLDNDNIFSSFTI